MECGEMGNGKVGKWNLQCPLRAIKNISRWKGGMVAEPAPNLLRWYQGNRVTK